MPSGSRLVASTVSPGAAVSNPATNLELAEQVLTVVQYDQQLATADEPQQRLHRRSPGLIR
ncbi:hypothetical protein MGAST_15155 [Mycobacterium gastri 'Wayne']|uniref:Uncharacterized protein n=1 Tax=Mycobacterium gastri TaxID=1777 RepID=A0A1X1VWT5_MYCGS|nr:hypothetical protein MGAST_15155 [Mycobacterium gastri 'Wayne']ORV74007.1 hypothetical protein AWC07_01980 [Mycobacterium gastri]